MCGVCPQNKNVRKNQGCGEFKKAPRPVFKRKGPNGYIFYYNCASKFIPQHISDFYRLYSYNKQFNVSLPYGQNPARYNEAFQVYENECNRIQYEKSEDERVQSLVGKKGR